MTRLVLSAPEAGAARRYRDLLVLACPRTLAELDGLIQAYVAIPTVEARAAVRQVCTQLAHGVRPIPEDEHE